MTGALAKALVKAQGEMENAALNKTNPHFRSKYADFVAIREATLPVLIKNGLAITQYPAVRDDGTFVLRTRLMHESGEYIEGEYPIAIDKPQAMGSALTYARRYSWSGITGIAADEDDDAQAAQDSSKAAKRVPAPPPAEAPEGGTGKAGSPPVASVVAETDVEVARLRRRWNALAKSKLPREEKQKGAEGFFGSSILEEHKVASLDELSAAQWTKEIDALTPTPLEGAGA